MQIENVSINDLCALYIGLYQPELLMRYLECRRNPVTHRIMRVSEILSITKGCLLFEHQLYNLLVLAGQEKKMKQYKIFKYLPRNQKEFLREKFLGSMLEKGYTYEEAEELFDFIKLNSHNVWRRRGIVENFKQLTRRLYKYYDHRDRYSVDPKYAERIKLELEMRLMESLIDRYN